MGIKMSPQNKFSVVCDGYVKYDAAAVDRLVIMQDWRDKNKKLLKIATSRPFCISFLRNLSWVILVWFLSYMYLNITKLLKLKMATK